jgi:hypothetical protein
MANNFWVAALVTPLLISEDGRNPEMSRWCYDNPSAYMRYLNYLQSSKLDWPVKTSGFKATAPSLLSLCFEAYRKKELHDAWHAITLQQQAKGGLVDFNTPEREAVLDILTWTEDEMRERLHLNTRAK